MACQLLGLCPQCSAEKRFCPIRFLIWVWREKVVVEPCFGQHPETCEKYAKEFEDLSCVIFFDSYYSFSIIKCHFFSYCCAQWQSCIIYLHANIICIHLHKALTICTYAYILYIIYMSFVVFLFVLFCLFINVHVPELTKKENQQGKGLDGVDFLEMFLVQSALFGWWL